MHKVQLLKMLRTEQQQRHKRQKVHRVLDSARILKPIRESVFYL